MAALDNRDFSDTMRNARCKDCAICVMWCYRILTFHSWFRFNGRIFKALTYVSGAIVFKKETTLAYNQFHFNENNQIAFKHGPMTLQLPLLEIELYGTAVPELNYQQVIFLVRLPLSELQIYVEWTCYVYYNYTFLIDGLKIQDPVMVAKCV